MELNGLNNVTVRKLNDGKTLDDINNASTKNGLSEIAIKNEKGTYIVYGKDLSTNCIDKNESLLGKQVDFGDLKGDVIYVNNNVSEMSDLYNKKLKTVDNVAAIMAGTGFVGTLALAITSKDIGLGAKILSPLIATLVIGGGADFIGKQMVNDFFGKESIKPNSKKLDSISSPV